MTQKDALEILKLGHNAFLTGPAGSGKTYVLNRYVEYLKKNNINPGITASTGIAATHLGGITIHSWSGIGIKDTLTDRDLKAIYVKKHVRERIENARVLIIDEISMLHGTRLDMVDRVCRSIKFNNNPFGGLQVVMCGDFFQLPPITRGDEAAGFAFESESWKNMNLNILYLEEQYRQADAGFLSVLNDIRNDRVTDDTMLTLEGRYNREIDGPIVATKLYTHNVDVDSLNNVELGKLPGDSKIFEMKSLGVPEVAEGLRKNCLAPEKLVLKIGSSVMFVKNNFDEGYVNGTLGNVIKFEKETGNPVVRTISGEEVTARSASWVIEDEGKPIAEIIQIPLRLAWAITIHKSQGMSLDAAEIDLSKSFVPGMGYVALSRVRTLEGMKLTGFNQMALKVNQQVIQVDVGFRAISEKVLEVLSGLTEKERLHAQKLFVAPTHLF